MKLKQKSKWGEKERKRGQGWATMKEERNEIKKNRFPFFNQMTSAEKIIRADQRKGLIVSKETVRVRQVELKMKLDLWGFKFTIKKKKS